MPTWGMLGAGATASRTKPRLRESHIPTRHGLPAKTDKLLGMKAFRCCLLLLLCLALPLQAALAAGWGGCMRHAGQSPTQAAQHDAALLLAPAAATDGSDCLHHHPAEAATPAVDHSCSNCSGCAVGAALTSSWLGWVETRVQQSFVVAPVSSHGAPTLRAPERPPRAIAQAA